MVLYELSVSSHRAVSTRPTCPHPSPNHHHPTSQFIASFLQADQLLAPQFSEDMTTITAHVGRRLGAKPPPRASQDNAPRSPPAPQRQTVLVSATLSRSVLTQTAKWCPQPEYVAAGGPSPTLAPPEPHVSVRVCVCALTSCCLECVWRVLEAECDLHAKS
jgi:superfamily II DNA/RNA helicase